MSSEVKICNLALGWLGANLIISLDDQSVEAQLCKANYALLRDAVLEEGKWTFATKRFKLVLNPQPPEYGYSRRFQLPNDVLIVISATPHKDDKNGTADFDWRREEQYILCDVDKVFAKCIIRVTSPTRFTQTFTQALAYRIGAELAVPLTESRAKEEYMQAMYQKRIDTALAIDGMQGKSDRLRSNSNIVKGR